MLAERRHGCVSWTLDMHELLVFLVSVGQNMNGREMELEGMMSSIRSLCESSSDAVWKFSWPTFCPQSALGPLQSMRSDHPKHMGPLHSPTYKDTWAVEIPICYLIMVVYVPRNLSLPVFLFTKDQLVILLKTGTREAAHCIYFQDAQRSVSSTFQALCEIRCQVLPFDNRCMFTKHQNVRYMYAFIVKHISNCYTRRGTSD